jgi:solute carrier family 26 (sodium-independent sulfate anion transporter), member 11
MGFMQDLWVKLIKNGSRFFKFSSKFPGCFVYFIFGSCKDITIGPTAILSLLTYTVVAKLNADLAVLTTFLSGCIIFLLGFFNLGFLMQFLSTPTILGFMNAATITITSGQIRRLLGIKSGSSSEFISSWEALFKHYDETKLYDTILGVTSLIILVGIRKASKMNSKSMFLRYLSISRNAIVVFGGILIAYLFYKNGIEPFNLTGEIASGFPSISLPPFSTVHNNQTYSFTEMVSTLGLSVISVPVISIIEAVAIAKSFSKGKVVDVTQEMCALGMCNFASSFFSSIPITGSFTRSAVNHSSGVQTTLGGIFTGAVVLLSLGVLTKTFFFIPKTSLAAVIIAAMFTMMEFRKVVEIYKTKRSDIIPFLGTFIVSLWLGLELGIIVGVAINVFFTLYTTSRPEIKIEKLKVRSCYLD